MLKLHRRDNERVVVRHMGERLEIVVKVDSSRRVSMGFDGPRSFEVMRAEIEPAPQAEGAAQR